MFRGPFGSTNNALPPLFAKTQTWSTTVSLSLRLLDWIYENSRSHSPLIVWHRSGFDSQPLSTYLRIIEAQASPDKYDGLYRETIFMADDRVADLSFWHITVPYFWHEELSSIMLLYHTLKSVSSKSNFESSVVINFMRLLYHKFSRIAAKMVRANHDMIWISPATPAQPWQKPIEPNSSKPR